MTNLKGSKTEANLLTAFAGESMARNKYTYYASQAKKEGYEQISNIFLETANNEKEHAKMWYKLLNDGIGNTMENLKNKLKESGLKITPQRRAIINILIGHENRHLSSEEIYDLVRENCPEIGLATVYRTMQLLDEIGVISKLNLDDGCIRYEINLNKSDCHNHHHLICKKCGKIIEVEDDLMDDVENKIQSAYKFKILDHDVKFYGICEDCEKDISSK